MEVFLGSVHSRFERLMTIIVQGHDITKHGAADVGLHYGAMYHYCIRHPLLYRELVGSTEGAE
jgi:hypothetical protein